MQRTGAYKVRGAYYKISTLMKKREKRTDHSICWKPCTGCCLCAAKIWSKGSDRYAYHHSTDQRLERTKSYGAEVILHGDVYDEACAHALSLQKKWIYIYSSIR